MSQVFGTRVLPPAEALPGEVSDAVEAWRAAAERTTKARAALGNHRRVGIAQARSEDVEAHAAAIEAGAKPPKAQHEERATQKARELERAAEAAELVESRARARMDERITEHAGAIAHAAQKRLSTAKQKYLAAIAALEEASEELRLGYALWNWASEPASSWKVRGLGIPVPRHADSEPSVDMVLDGLRAALEPRRRPSLPSPFGAPHPQPEAEPAAAHSFEAELAAGSSPPAA